jgi:hypothetical protein
MHQRVNEISTASDQQAGEFNSLHELPARGEVVRNSAENDACYHWFGSNLSFLS